MHNVTDMVTKGAATFGLAAALFVGVALTANALSVVSGGAQTAAVANAQQNGLTQAQKQAVLNLLQVFGANQAVINQVSAALNGTPTGAPSARVGASASTTEGEATHPEGPGHVAATEACLALSRNLYRGTEDSHSNGEVTQLQDFLESQGYLHASSTGYFGPLTQEAVQQWQAVKGVVASGTPATTGWGVVGPRTRGILTCAPHPGTPEGQASSSPSEDSTASTSESN